MGSSYYIPQRKSNARESTFKVVTVRKKWMKQIEIPHPRFRKLVLKTSRRALSANFKFFTVKNGNAND